MLIAYLGAMAKALQVANDEALAKALRDDLESNMHFVSEDYASAASLEDKATGQGGMKI